MDLVWQPVNIIVLLSDKAKASCFLHCKMFDFFFQIKYGDTATSEGVLFATYSALIGESQAGGQRRTRIKQILDWCKPDFDGVVSFHFSFHHMLHLSSTDGQESLLRMSWATDSDIWVLCCHLNTLTSNSGFRHCTTLLFVLNLSPLQIIFDECHKAKNATSTKMGKAVLDLQNKLPRARVVYASATGRLTNT